MKQVFLEKGKDVSDEAVDRLEHMLRTKFELKSGFAEPQQLARHMHAALRALDVNDNEDMDIKRFRTVMAKFNCGEDMAAVDALFHRYDVADKEVVTMNQFSLQLFGLKVVPQSNPQTRDVLKQVRKLLLARGENGFRGLVRILRRMDDNGNRQLEPRELADGLATYGLHLNNKELATLFKSFDRDGNGHISITEFIVGLRPTISPARLAIVKMAFLRLDKNPDGTVTMEELRSIYRTDKHPSVLDGTKTPDEVLSEFNDCWDRNGDDIITEAEFIEYYKDLSASIDNDAYFELMLRNAWHIAGGKGAAANTANLRCLVTRMDGTQSVECIIDDLGLPDKKPETLAAALRKQGVTDILKVEVATAV